MLLPRQMLLPRLAPGWLRPGSGAARVVRRALCTSVEVPPLRLEPQLEKVISRFESSMKAGRRYVASACGFFLNESPRLWLWGAVLDAYISCFVRASSLSSRSTQQEKSTLLIDGMWGQLQRFRVQRVLLVCSDFDSYTFEEDGCAITRPPQPPYTAPLRAASLLLHAQLTQRARIPLVL